MRVLIVGSDREQCGIAEHTGMLVEGLKEHGVAAVVMPPDPQAVAAGLAAEPYDLIHINHHAALHSRFTPEWVRRAAEEFPVIVTQHDTFETRAIMLERGMPDFVGAAHMLIVHEQVEGLTTVRGKAALHRAKTETTISTEVYYLPQGIPEVNISARPPYILDESRPILGTVGFPFPWKNQPLLVELAKQAGWGVLIIAPGATDVQVAEIVAHGGADQPIDVINHWLPREQVVAMLRQCTATAFLYQTGNSGTSAAIRLGIAAGRPLIAFPCRQFEELQRDQLGAEAIMWANNGETDVLGALNVLDPREDEEADRNIAHWSEKILVLKQRDSWHNIAGVIREIYLRAIKRKEGTL